MDGKQLNVIKSPFIKKQSLNNNKKIFLLIFQINKQLIKEIIKSGINIKLTAKPLKGT